VVIKIRNLGIILMHFDTLKSRWKYVLASGSPRRKYLLEQLGLEFTLRPTDVEEGYPEELKGHEIAEYLSLKKGLAGRKNLQKGELQITCDTLVWLEGAALNKPGNYSEACEMLKRISGKPHEVFSGVTLSTLNNLVTFSSKTRVWFKKLEEQEIDYYVTNFKPFDKAGSYGAQEWIGYIGMEKIEGCYFNVMGLPLAELYMKLRKFSEENPNE
jgi:septum formation protein